ncbi:heme ABC transporter ATP-binding protein [Lentzea sp. NPDC051213]|uniref:heme ABC transporter ATP-binding protein n=1 Tax=Lentzea sp. NPDC051213 TaxID=3364126 RepID=UPI0037A92BB4
MKPELFCENVSVSLGGQEILKKLDLTVKSGEVLALVGPNGAGKSTALAVLAGDVRPDAGSVWLDGKPLDEWTARETAQRRAVLLQRITLSFPFTVAEVIRMGRAPWDDGNDDVIAEVMAQTEMAAFAGRKFTTLSGGEQARAALARVLAQRAGVLLLDEPTAALDIRHSELVLRTAKAQADQGSAVLVVLHDLGMAGAHADRVAVMSDGSIVADGPPAEVLTEELLSEVYRHRVEVFAHPRTGRPVVLPWRGEA